MLKMPGGGIPGNNLRRRTSHGNWNDQDWTYPAYGREARTDQQTIGRLVKAERKARMGRNPQTGEAIKIKAKTVVKFRVAKSAKDVIAPPKK